ncbi:MAG: dTDP-4-dehydrorhamnose reductase [Candidatus Aminicenantes bacterium]|nr:dTDP-4-dehydrorhamnose reductase [Candidatus Aminicenantes bacterium]
MKIALIGADGQLGTDLARSLNKADLIQLFYPDFDITKTKETQNVLSRISPDIIINTAAYHRVDECEDNPRKSFEVNALAVRELALICQSLNSILVHFSTDYVFDGKKRIPYSEDDVPNPLNAYAVSKLAGEYFVRNLLERYFLIRTCGLYGEAGCWGKGSNFVDTMVACGRRGEVIGVVNDQWVTPTATAELAQKIGELIKTDHFGLFHLTNEGQCTWYDFAKEIFALMSLQVRLEAVGTASYGAKARRPPYSVLENKNAKKIGLSPFSHWKDALRGYLFSKNTKP